MIVHCYAGYIYDSTAFANSKPAECGADWAVWPEKIGLHLGSGFSVSASSSGCQQRRAGQQETL